MDPPNDPDDLVCALAKACRVVGKLGLTHSTLGHVSLRLPGEPAMLIRGKGENESGVQFTQPTDVVVVDFSGRTVQARPGLRAPSECFLHSSIYRLNPGVKAIVHAHLRCAVQLTILDQPLQPMYGAYDIVGAQLAVDGIPTFESPVMIDDEIVGDEFATFMGAAPGALMRGHGVTVVGKTLEEAVVRLAALADLCLMTMEILSSRATARPVSADEIRAVSEKLRPDRPRGTASEASLIMGRWTYYAAVTGE